MSREITDRSKVERGIKDAEAVKLSLTKTEKAAFNKIKRSLLKTFVNPNHAVKMLIDLSAMEYIAYTRKPNSRIARSLIDILSELDLSPKSRKTSEVSKTLSQIFQSVAKEEKGE